MYGKANYNFQNYNMQFEKHEGFYTIFSPYKFVKVIDFRGKCRHIETTLHLKWAGNLLPFSILKMTKIFCHFKMMIK